MQKISAARKLVKGPYQEMQRVENLRARLGTLAGKKDTEGIIGNANDDENTTRDSPKELI